MNDYSGRWVGRLNGTNSGNFVLTLEQSGSVLRGELRLSDAAYGLAVFGVEGSTRGDTAEFALEPREAAEGVSLSPGTAKVAVQADGSLAGTWETVGQTFGGFVAVREAQPDGDDRPEAPTAAAATAIQYEKRTRVRSCVVDHDTLRRLFRDLMSGADEAARLDLARRQGQSGVELAAVRSGYSVTIMARGEDGEQVITLDPKVLETGLLPKPLRSISLDIGPYYRLINNGSEAPNRASVSLDFSRPPLVDVSNPSGTPTPNDSSIAVNGNDSIWVAGVYQKLLSTLAQGRVRTGWLHSAHVYDVLLFAAGLPASLILAASTASRVQSGSPYVWAAFVFVALVALMAFRVGFSFVRWLLPYVEFTTLSQPLHRQIRIVLATITLGVLASLVAAALWGAFQTG